MSLSDDIRLYEEMLRHFNENYAPMIQHFNQNYAPMIRQAEEVRHSPQFQQFINYVNSDEFRQYSEVVRQQSMMIQRLHEIPEVESAYITGLSAALDDISALLQIIQRLRDSQAMEDVRGYLDSMDPEDRNRALHSLQEFLESLIDQNDC